MIEVVPYTPTIAADWNRFNAGAHNGHFMFDRGFMDYHSDRFQDASWVAIKDGRLAGLFPANRRGNEIHSHQGLTFGGLIKEDLRCWETLEALDRWISGCRQAGARELVYKPLPHIYHRRPAEEALFWLHRNGAQLIKRDLSTAIRFASPGVWSGRRRRGLKRAHAFGLVFKLSDRWEPYWALLISVLNARHETAPVHSIDEIRMLSGRFPDAIELYTAELDGDVVAGTVLFRTAEVAHAQYIASGDKGRETGALDGLYDYLFTTLRDRATWFDFGISNDPQSGELNAGLISQKEEFGGGGVAYDRYRLTL